MSPEPRHRRGRVLRLDVRLRMDPVACDAFGYCTEILPELIGQDEWGYPIIDSEAVPAHLRELAERAVRDCPRKALFFEKVGR